MTRQRSAGRRPSPRVYRRRRMAAAVLAVGAGALGALGLGTVAGRLGGGPLTASEPGISVTGARLVSGATYVVAPGDTLWSIARRAQPAGDVRPLVQSLERSRQGEPLRVGERITL